MLTSCEKSSKDNDEPTVTGTWEKVFSLSGEVYKGESVQKQDGKDFSGSFVFNDGSGYTILLSSSEIDGDDITIVWVHGDSYTLEFEGTLNDDFDYMSGSYYVGGSFLDTCYAEKVSDDKSTEVNDKSIGNMAQEMLYSID